jgi:hypothetical protein
VQTIVVDRVSVVNPQLASIIRNDAKTIMAGAVDSHSTSPACSKLIGAGKALPPTSCVAVIDHMSPTTHVWLTTAQILATTTLTKVECVFHEQTMSVDSIIRTMIRATCAHDRPSIPSIRAPVPEKHAGMTTTFKHLKPNQAPWGSKAPVSFSIAPTMQAIIIDRVSIVDPQLASIIGYNR